MSLRDVAGEPPLTYLRPGTYEGASLKRLGFSCPFFLREDFRPPVTVDVALLVVVWVAFVERKSGRMTGLHSSVGDVKRWDLRHSSW